MILVFCVKNDFAQLIYRVTLRMLATDFRFFLVSINHALYSSVRFNPLQDQAFLVVPFRRMNVSHYLFSFPLIDIYYMSECAADNKNLFSK